VSTATAPSMSWPEIVWLDVSQLIFAGEHGSSHCTLTSPKTTQETCRGHTLTNARITPKVNGEELGWDGSHNHRDERYDSRRQNGGLRNARRWHVKGPVPRLTTPPLPPATSTSAPHPHARPKRALYQIVLPMACDWLATCDFGH
jgi:hypothetical protein